MAISRRVNSGHPLFIGYGRTGAESSYPCQRQPNPNTEEGNKVPDKILVQVVESEDQNKIVRQGEKSGLFEAFGYGLIWLEQALGKDEE